MKENQFIATNVQIWDKFDLPLQEDVEVEYNSFYTIGEIK